MYNTHYANANGLPDSRQLTTARDLAILTRAVMRDYPQYYKLFSQESFTFRGQTMRNHNHLLFRMPGVDGVKTGYTNASGYNLAVSAVRGNRRLIAVVLGGSSGAVRDNNAEDLLLTGFDVMGRRDRGEKIEVAQNMFEPEPAGGRIQPSIEQGDVEQEGLNVILAAATNPKRLSSVKIVDPSTTALKKGKWSVQVGSFKTKSDAKEQISFVSKRFSSHFKSANGVADKAGRGYRARFGGFTEASAKSACKDMKAKRLACMVVAPG
jgi:D-alanyl-D-alanine carboxypeptidase (penicillin-binding protein 5/6)